jgi:hypothetical protein
MFFNNVECPEIIVAKFILACSTKKQDAVAHRETPAEASG